MSGAFLSARSLNFGHGCNAFQRASMRTYDAARSRRCSGRMVQGASMCSAANSWRHCGNWQTKGLQNAAMNLVRASHACIWSPDRRRLGRARWHHGAQISRWPSGPSITRRSSSDRVLEIGFGLVWAFNAGGAASSGRVPAWCSDEMLRQAKSQLYEHRCGQGRADEAP
jgi:hypothetical protein